MKEKFQKAGLGGKRELPLVISWVSTATALIGLFVSVAGGVTWFITHHKQQVELNTNMALAHAQANQGEYEASIQTYADILKRNSFYRPALDQQLNATVLWVENFHVLARKDQSAADLAAPALDRIMAILDSGLTRSKGSQAADVQAHLGWAHWLNQHIAEREFGPVAEQNLRAALASDPSNVYANAMLGNWILQNGGSFGEAIQHLDTAVASGNARPFVRRLQLGGLIDHDKAGARAQVVIAVNDMRKSGEQLDEEYKKHVLGFCFDPIVTDHEELTESLTAVPPKEAWETYLWIDDRAGGQAQRIVHDFIAANLLELTGERQQSLDSYRLLRQKLKNQPGTMKDLVGAAIARLSHS